MTDLKRPEIGKTTQRVRKRPVCKACGCFVIEGGGCNYDCPNDYSHCTSDLTFHAVYEVTEKFIGDEPYVQPTD